ncbi:MAG: metallophosphoesterase family protein [Chloroflexi bacterium]|nr:metallophosphoesterase family protein [Chloroflexota bacterium]
MTSVLLLSDIHGNLPALDAVIEDAERHGPSSEVWVMGDSVGYGAQPNEVVERLRALPNLTMVKGNHEAAAIGEISTANFNPTAGAAADWTLSILDPETKEFLIALPLVTERLGITICHGTPRNPIWEYMFTSRIAELNLEHFGTLGCVHGHTHIPSVFGRDASGIWRVKQAIDGDEVILANLRWFVNPGSVGQPRDGDPRAAYALLHVDDQQESVHIGFHRVEYNVSLAQDRILDAGLPESLAFRLSQGH